MGLNSIQHMPYWVSHLKSILQSKVIAQHETLLFVDVNVFSTVFHIAYSVSSKEI